MKRSVAVAAAVPAAAMLAFAASASAATKPVCPINSLPLLKSGTLTIGTDNPAFPPWFGGGEKNKPWQINDPSTGKGYESAVAYQVARRLGFAPARVSWTVVPFSKSFAPGKKDFDMFINQVSFRPERARNVAFSSSYYNVSQAIVAIKGTPGANSRTIAGVKGLRFGAQVGTTSLEAIQKQIRPTQEPRVYDTNNDAVNALKAKQIDAIVVDLPTAYFVTAAQVENSKIVGQLPKPGGVSEYFGIVMPKGSRLQPCVNRALAQMRKDGTLRRLERRWLAGAAAPLLK